jgi:hypothetical protein
MLTAADCRERARNCKQIAKSVIEPNVREDLLRTATGWLRLAQSIEREFVCGGTSQRLAPPWLETIPPSGPRTAAQRQIPPVPEGYQPRGAAGPTGASHPQFNRHNA